MNKEKALKNQGLEFREDIQTVGGKENYNSLYSSQSCKYACADGIQPSRDCKTVRAWKGYDYN